MSIIHYGDSLLPSNDDGETTGFGSHFSESSHDFGIFFQRDAVLEIPRSLPVDLASTFILC